MESTLDWTPEHLAVVKLEPKDPAEPTSPLKGTIVHQGEGFPDGDEGFADFLHFLIEEIFGKKPDTGAGSPCKAWGFLPNEKGEEDRDLLENGLLMATDAKAFKTGLQALLERFPRLPGAKPGLVIVARFHAQVEGLKRGARFLALFHLDFQDALRLEHEHGLSLSRLDEVVIRKLTRGILYPLVEVEGPRHDLVKILCRPASDPFPSLLAVTPPTTTEELLQGAVAQALYATGKGAEARFKAYFEKPAPRRRELFGEDRFVKVKDLIPPTEAQAVARESARTARDMYAKEQKVKIDVDGAVSVDARLDQLGESFFFAEKDGEKYLLIKGKKFVSTRPQLTSVDFMSIESLEELLERIRG